MNEFLKTAKAVAESNRARIIMLLTQGRLCLCQIIKILELSPSTISKHMSILQNANLVTARKEQKWVFYSLNKRGASTTVRSALKFIRDCLKEDQQIAKDSKKLAKVKKIDKQKLCKCYDL